MGLIDIRKQNRKLCMVCIKEKHIKKFPKQGGKMCRECINKLTRS